MYLALSKKSRRTDRSRSARYKAKAKAKEKARSNRIYQRV